MKKEDKTLNLSLVVGWGSFGLAAYSLYKNRTEYFIMFLLVSLIAWMIELSEYDKRKGK